MTKETGKLLDFLNYSSIIQSNFEKRNYIFDLVINEREYSVDLQKKTQTNKTTKYIHEISNDIPMTHKFEWFWEEFSKHTPYSLHHIDLIEQEFLNYKDCVEIKIKRHDND